MAKCSIQSWKRGITPPKMAGCRQYSKIEAKCKAIAKSGNIQAQKSVNECQKFRF